MVLVPFPGFLYLYLHKKKGNGGRYEVLVPFSGFLYLYRKYIFLKNKGEIVLVPFSGFLYLYRRDEVKKRKGINVLVPFSGFLYLYEPLNYNNVSIKSSRPLLGVLISLRNIEKGKLEWVMFSSPSRGSYISIVAKEWYGCTWEFSSPSRGSYISMSRRLLNLINNKVLVPFSGFLYLYLSSQSLELYTHISAFAAQM